MTKEWQVKQAKMFKDLHSNNVLCLPNAWNGGSAKVFKKQGFVAIGTTSAGIAYSMGYSDGEMIKFSDVIQSGDCRTMLNHEFSSLKANQFFGN